MITVYHLTASRSERIVWLLEELGIAYELEVHAREATGAAPPAYKALHPLGKSPVIRDGDLTLAESGAIVEYLVNRHAGGRLGVRAESADYPRYLYWMHFAEGSLMTLMLIAFVLQRTPEAKDSAARGRIQARLAQMLAFVDAELAGRDYFLGAAFTAADVMMAFPFTTMRKYLDCDLAPYANIAAWLARIEARPAYRKAMARAP